ncbi:unnamed protein product [Candidula unifasciata]|uniref:G-protein coupled receptors family 1 profile domain-containing protein n=1 Tax=Candidula unifasciata TaxID=100452 RepID=A0A8S3Z0H5_9EUPU|nr:unnamed protein product [Candidula unifasciata]
MGIFQNNTEYDFKLNDTTSAMTPENGDNNVILDPEVSISAKLNISGKDGKFLSNISKSNNLTESQNHYLTKNPGSSFLDALTTTSRQEVTNQTDANVLEPFPVSNYTVSDGYSAPFENIFINESQLYSGASLHDSFTNSTFDSARQSDDARFLSNDTSFSTNLSAWLTVVPHLSPDNNGAVSGEDDVTSIVIFKVVILGCISLVGSFGNILVIWSVVKERHLHRPPFYFLLSMGVTDLSRAVFCVPVVMTTVMHGSRWRHGESACKLFAFATSFFVFSSALSLLAIAIDRHVSIVYSKTYRRRSLGIANLVVAVIIWIIAFSVSFPPVVGVGNYVFIPDESQCAYQHKHYTHNDSISSVLVFIAILFLTYFLYFRIFRFLRGHRRMRPLQHTPALSTNWAFIGPGANGQAFINWLNGFGGQAPVRQGGQRAVQRLNFGRVVNLSTAKNEHLTRLFLVVTLVFGIAWSAYITLSLWRIFFDASLIPSVYITVSAWLGYGQLAICPIVYFLMRGPMKKPSKAAYEQTEKREFLLENKTEK